MAGGRFSNYEIGLCFRSFTLCAMPYALSYFPRNPSQIANLSNIKHHFTRLNF